MGLIPQPSFSLSLAPASNPFNLVRDPSPRHRHPRPLFSAIIPCRSGHCQSSGTAAGRRAGWDVHECLHVRESLSRFPLVCVVVCVRSPLPRFIRVCDRTAQTEGSCRVPRGGAESGEGVGGEFPARKSAASNHMSVQGGSFGSRPGLEGNQQHMSRMSWSGEGDMGQLLGSYFVCMKRNLTFCQHCWDNPVQRLNNPLKVIFSSTTVLQM